MEGALSDSDGSAVTSSLIDRVRQLEQRGKNLLEDFSKPASIRRVVSTNNLLNESGNSSTKSDVSSEEKRSPAIQPPYLSTSHLTAARRLFRSTVSLSQNEVPVISKPPLENSVSNILSCKPAASDGIWSLQQELSQLALQRDEEKAKLINTINQMRSANEQSRVDFERRLVEKEESLSRAEYNVEQCNKRIFQLEDELSVTHDALTSQERELDRLRSELALHTNAANQLRAVLNDVSERFKLSNESNPDIFSVPPLPPPSCQSIMVLTHSVSACIRAAWDQTSSVNAHCDRLTNEIAGIKMECAQSIERLESERARTIAAIQAEADHALKLGQQRLSAAQERLRSAEDQLELTREDLSKQLAYKDTLTENLRKELQQIRDNNERDRGDAIQRATEAERLLAESEANQLRASALASDADGRCHQLELERDELKRRYLKLESELASEHEKLCRIWEVDGTRANITREYENREADLRRELADYEDKYKFKLHEMEEIHLKNQGLEIDLRKSKSQVDELSAELNKTLSCLKSYQGELDRLSNSAVHGEKYQEEIESLSTLLEESSKRCSTFEKAKGQLDADLVSARQEIDQLRKDCIASRLAASESIKTAQLLAKRHRDLEMQARQETNQLREEVDKLLKKLTEQEGQVATINAEKKQLEAAGGCQQSEQLTAMRALAKKLANAERQLLLSTSKNPHSNVLDNNGEVEALSSKLSTVEEKLKNALVELNEAVIKRKEAEKQVHEATKVVKKLKEKLDCRRTKSSNLHTELAKAQSEAMHYRVQLQAAASYVSRLEEELHRRSKSGFPIRASPVSELVENIRKKEKMRLSATNEHNEGNEIERDMKIQRKKSRQRKLADAKQFSKNPSPDFFGMAKMVVPRSHGTAMGGFSESASN